jgi:hypothetical protein
MNRFDSLVIDSVWILRSKEWSYYEKETRVVYMIISRFFANPERNG